MLSALLKYMLELDSHRNRAFRGTQWKGHATTVFSVLFGISTVSLQVGVVGADGLRFLTVFGTV